MPDRKPGGDIEPGLLTEYLTADLGYFVRSAREFERFQSPFQTVEVHDTAPFGTLFRLDGHFMTSEKDEFFYHENLVHTAAITHPAPEKALIIGGGDGGSAEELLKYPTMKSVTLVEIDLAVIDIARKYFRAVHRGAFADPRLAIKLEDGFAFVRGTLELTLRMADIVAGSSARLLLHSKGIGSTSDVEAALAFTPEGTGTRVRWTADVKHLGGLLKAVPQGLIKAAAQKVIADAWTAVEGKLQS